MTYGKFCTETGAIVSTGFFENVMLPMYMASPDEIDEKVFYKMFTRHSLLLADAEYKRRIKDDFQILDELLQEDKLD